MSKFMVIGERIHCISPAMREAFETRNPEPILQRAKEQLDAGADYLDLNIGQEKGMDLIEPLLAIVPQAKILMLTGYASIATAVSAVKLGAYHYLPKPCGIDDILKAFDIQAANPKDSTSSDERLSLGHHEWEYIHQVLEECQGNVSEAARVLKIHRRTLQRKLQKKTQGRYGYRLDN